VIATYGSDAYKIVLTLHVLCAIVGFGAVFLNGLYGAQAKARQGPAGLAVMQANMLVSKVAEYFIYAVGATAILLVLMGDDVVEWGQAWIWLSLVLYVVDTAVSHGLLWPRMRRMAALSEELNAMGPPPAGASGPPPQVVEMEAIGKQVGMLGAFLNISLIVILYLMVFKPGI
jgi:uncharacterized membrane protein